MKRPSLRHATGPVLARSLALLRKQLLQCQERQRTVRSELHQLDSRLGRGIGVVEAARAEGPSMGSTLAAQDGRRRTAMQREAEGLRAQEAHLQRLLSGKEATKKLFKF